MFCSKCGSNIDDGATFCSKCGLATYTGSVAMAVARSVPAQAVPTRPYAGFWMRFLAYIIDALVLGVFTIPILVGAALLMGIGTSIANLPRGRDPFENGMPPFFAEFVLVFVLVIIGGGWLYYALLESSEWQGTAGKKALGLQVTDMNGTRVSFSRASGRYFAKMVTQLVPLGFGFILAGITDKKQALHDMIASCLVLRKL